MTDTNEPAADDFDAALEAKEAARKARKDKIAAAERRQRFDDLDKINELELSYGDNNIAIVPVLYVEGLPTMIAGRAPTDPELKRYRHRIAAARKPGQEVDPLASVKASEELADVCRVFPDDDAYAKIRAARPGMHAQLGAACVRLALSSGDAEGKA